MTISEELREAALRQLYPWEYLGAAGFTAATSYEDDPCCDWETVQGRAARILPQTFTVGPNEASVLFSKLCRELLITGLTFHDARATALTLLARRMDVLTLARISRHKDLRILMNVYYRESVEDIAARLN